MYRLIKGFTARGRHFTKSGNFQLSGTAFPTPCTNWHDILYGKADPRVPRLCRVSRGSVLRVAPVGHTKMLIFGLWVKTIPTVCRFAAILPVM